MAGVDLSTDAPLYQPYFSTIIIPDLASLSLTEAEQALLGRLQTKAFWQRSQMLLADSYYRGMQLITDLGIAIPPQLRGLRTLVGWPRIAVDPLVYRLFAEGFRLKDATDTDQDLSDIWLENRMNAEQALAYKDALVKGRGYFTVGSPTTPGDAPVIGVESPLNMSVEWDVRSLKPKAALQSYWLDGQRHAALYTPTQTVHLGADDVTGKWEITARDVHNFGWVPVVRMANEPESDRRDGVSEITPEIRSITDAACRTLLGLEVAREFYSVPQKIILGAAEEDFQASDGTPKAAWDTYINKVLALERDEDGNLPEVKQFQPYDPSVFTKLIDMYASQMAGILGAPPQDLGLYTQGNPISSEALQVSESRRDRYARHKQATFEAALVDTMQMAIRFDNNGVLPDEFRRMQVDWMPPEMLNLAATSDALFKQEQMGAVPATSDVTLKKLGYTAIERAQLEQDRKLDAGASVLAELASSLEVKQARADKAVAADLTGPTAPPTAPTPPANGPAKP